MWKPIDTLKYENKRSYALDSDTVFLYVSEGPYSMYHGPVVGFMTMHLRANGAFNYLSCTVEGVSGYEYENDFKETDITHWMPLPEPPQSSKDAEQ